MTHCPICDAASTADFELFDDRYGYPGQFALMHCAECGHRFLDGTHFSDADIQALYSGFYPRKNLQPGDYQPHQERFGFNAWLDGAKASAFRWVPKNVKVLDVGCGFGQALGYYAARNCEAWGVDSDENAKRIADTHGFNVRIGLFRSKDYPSAYFDFVTMDQVIEHMRDPVDTLSHAKVVLKEDGALIVSTPNAEGWGTKAFGKRWIHWHVPYHLHFFTERSMHIAARRAGLTLVGAQTITNSTWLLYQWLHLAIRRRPGTASPFWSGTRTYRVSEKVAIRTLNALHRIKLSHGITRLLDSLGWGDSYLFTLRPA